MRKEITVQEIAKTLDHSLLDPDMTITELKEGCELGKEYDTISVCIMPHAIPLANETLKDSDVLVTSIVSFPHGTATTASKVAEAENALDMGAKEVDMVINYGRVLSGDTEYLRKELKAVADAVHNKGAILKVIFENHYLNDEQIVLCCKLCKEANVDYIKTSTGYAPSGSTMEDLKLMEKHADGMQVKSAGGVRTLDDVLEILAIGATRIGTSSTVDILTEAKQREKNGTLFLEVE